MTGQEMIQRCTINNVLDINELTELINYDSMNYHQQISDLKAQLSDAINQATEYQSQIRELRREIQMLQRDIREAGRYH